MADRPYPVIGPGTPQATRSGRAQGRPARPATGPVGTAAIRRRIRIPMRFADGYSATATVVSFTGLTDAQQHVALELNNPDKGAQLGRLGITIARQVPTALHLTGTNAAYLATKARRGAHDLRSRGLDRGAEPHRHVGPAHLGIADR